MSFGIEDAYALQDSLVTLNGALEGTMRIQFGEAHTLDTATSGGANWRVGASTQTGIRRVLKDGETVIPLAAVPGTHDDYVWYRLHVGNEGEGYVREDALGKLPFIQIADEGQINSSWLTADELRQQIVLETQRGVKFREMAAISDALAALLQTALNRTA